MTLSSAHLVCESFKWLCLLSVFSPTSVDLWLSAHDLEGSTELGRRSESEGWGLVASEIHTMVILGAQMSASLGTDLTPREAPRKRGRSPAASLLGAKLAPAGSF